MLGLLRQRRWLGFTLFALAVVLACMVLSRWQWHRHEQRVAENAQLDATISAPVTPLADVLAATPGSAPRTPVDLSDQWRLVTATGTFDTAAEVAVRRRPLNGRTGFWIVTPLVTDSGVVLVNRGWAPSGKDAATNPQVPPAPSGTITVTGRLRAPEPPRTTEAPPVGQAWSVEPAALLAGMSGPVYDAYIELRESTPAASAGLVTLTEDPGHRGWNNLVYSVQWILFGLVAAFGWWRLMRQEQQGQARIAAMSDASPRTRAEPVEPEL